MKRLILLLFIFLVACIPQKSQPRGAAVQPREVAALQGGNTFDPPVILDVNEAGQLVIMTMTPVPSTAVPPTSTNTATPIPPTDTPAPTSTATAVPPTPTIPPTTPLPGPIAPFPAASLCPDTGTAHDTSEFHTLWDSVNGCHYDHEHGIDPFVPEVAAAFPDMDLLDLLGGVGVGHTNPSSPAENVHKHGGMKWDVTMSHSAGCDGEVGSPTGVDAFVSQYHAFGDYAIEFESRVHSAVGLLRQCRTADPTDYGYIFVNQHQDYGQRVSPYQGTVLPYPDTPSPPYNGGFSPYFTVDCAHPTHISCRLSRQFVIDRNANAASTWVSRPQAAPIGSPLFAILFRLRDAYQLLDFSDLIYPFTFQWICSRDGGLTYDATMPGCRWNNSTTRIHEIHGIIPAAWDGLPGFDTDARPGRITAEGYVTAFGTLNPDCTGPGIDCHPIKMIEAFVGGYAATFGLLPGSKGTLAPGDAPERDICFLNGEYIHCDEGGLSSGWIGQTN